MFGLIKKKRRPMEVADRTSLNSMQGKFIGQTESLAMEGQQQHAWGGLFNPVDSGVHMFFDTFTITNFSSQFLNAEIWFNSKLPGKGIPSSLIHPANLALTPLPQPKVELLYASQVNGTPMGGINVFNRTVAPSTTLISESSKGSIILPPGGSLAIFVRSPGPFKYETRFAFTWWEDTNAAGGPL